MDKNTNYLKFFSNILYFYSYLINKGKFIRCSTSKEAEIINDYERKYTIGVVFNKIG